MTIDTSDWPRAREALKQLFRYRAPQLSEADLEHIADNCCYRLGSELHTAPALRSTPSTAAEEQARERAERHVLPLPDHFIDPFGSR